MEEFKVPGWPFHRANMVIKDRKKADTLLTMIVGPALGATHLKWRKKTHTPVKAAKIAVIMSMFTDVPFEDALTDSLGHIIDDNIYNKLNYKNRKEDLNGSD